MNYVYIDQAVAIHSMTIEPLRGAPVGASDLQIAAVEARLGATFPPAYREFLRWIGNDRDGVLRDEGCLIGDVENNVRGLAGLLRAHGQPAPGYRPLVFAARPGQAATWFRLDERVDDPTVFAFAAGDRVIQALGPFSQWLLAEVAGSVFRGGEATPDDSGPMRPEAAAEPTPPLPTTPTNPLPRFAHPLNTQTALLGYALPLLVSLLLDPGSNFHRLPDFAGWQLLLLGACGMVETTMAALALFPQDRFRIVYGGKAPIVPERVAVHLFVLAMGGMTLLALGGIFGPFSERAS